MDKEQSGGEMSIRNIAEHQEWPTRTSLKQRIAELERELAGVRDDLAWRMTIIEEMRRQNARLRELPLKILEVCRTDEHLREWPSLYEVVKLRIEECRTSSASDAMRLDG
jgi:hypothetical protein